MKKTNECMSSRREPDVTFLGHLVPSKKMNGTERESWLSTLLFAVSMPAVVLVSMLWSGVGRGKTVCCAVYCRLASRLLGSKSSTRAGGCAGSADASALAATSQCGGRRRAGLVREPIWARNRMCSSRRATTSCCSFRRAMSSAVDPICKSPSQKEISYPNEQSSTSNSEKQRASSHLALPADVCSVLQKLPHALGAAKICSLHDWCPTSHILAVAARRDLLQEPAQDFWTIPLSCNVQSSPPTQMGGRLGRDELLATGLHDVLAVLKFVALDSLMQALQVVVAELVMELLLLLPHVVAGGAHGCWLSLLLCC
eukprot:m.312257 g.312257  ORF g.312257 m.312257 type:complete len:313 (-) comp55382_c1_seq22:16-954(-)